MPGIDKIQDAYGDTLQVGDKVTAYGDPNGERGTITKIYDSQDMEGASPRIFVAWPSCGEDWYTAGSQATGPWDSYGAAFRADDLELAITTAPCDGTCAGCAMDWDLA